MKIIINSERSLVDSFNILTKEFEDNKYITLNINTGKARTLSQNALSHAWYSEISRKEKEYLPEDVKNLCKLTFGLPILRADDDEYNYACEAIDVLSYPDKVKAMALLPCTSLMSTKQLGQYLDDIQKYYTGRVDLRF